MGLLQLASSVSGAGKGIGRGLEQMQSTMGSMQLLQIRDEMERERMRETWGHDEGVLQKRQAFDLARDDRQNSQALDRQEQQNDFSASQSRIQREFERTKDTAAAQAALEKELRDRGYKKEDAQVQAAEKLAEWKRNQVSSDRKFQQEAGLKLTEKTMDLQKPESSGTVAGKLDPNVNATLKVYDQELQDLGDELKNVMTKPDRAAAIQRRMESIRNEQFKLLGRSRGESTAQRPPLRFPQ